MLAAALCASGGCTRERPSPAVGVSIPALERTAVPDSASSVKSAAIPEQRLKDVEMAIGCGEEWFGLYVLGQKTGSMRTKAMRTVHDGREAFVMEQTTILDAQVGQKKVRRQVDSSRVYALDGKGELLAFRETQTGDGGDSTLTGKCLPEGVRLVRSVAGLPDREMNVAATGETIDDALASLVVLRTGGERSGVAFDTETKMGDEKTTVSLVQRRRETVGGEETTVSELSMRMEDSRTDQTFHVLPDGRTLRIRYGDVLTAEAEPRESAMRKGRIEVLGSTKIILEGGGNPQTLEIADRDVGSSVIYRIQGAPQGFFTDMPSSQSVLDERAADVADATLLKVSSRRPEIVLPLEGLGEAVRRMGLEKWLEASMTVDSDAPEVIALSRRAAGSGGDAMQVTANIARFVYGYLEKAYGVSSDRATRVIELKKGDCTEHALLFTALARAAGIPARRLHGLVYMDSTDGAPALYWHEWAEAFVGEWVSVDPTFDQPVADAGHIAFGNEDQKDVAALFGQLKIGVERVERHREDAKAP